VWNRYFSFNLKTHHYCHNHHYKHYSLKLKSTKRESNWVPSRTVLLPHSFEDLRIFPCLIPTGTFSQLHTCEMVSSVIYPAGVKFWCGVSSCLVKTSSMSTSNSLLVQKTNVCIWLIRYPGLLVLFLILHLSFLLPLLCVLEAGPTVRQLAFLRRSPECFNHLSLDTASFSFGLSSLQHEHRWNFFMEIQFSNINRPDICVPSDNGLSVAHLSFTYDYLSSFDFHSCTWWHTDM
jgi:hypothetical protein